MECHARAAHIGLALILGGCGVEVRYTDAPVTIDRQAEAVWAQGDASMLMGIYEEQLFRQLSPGDVVRVRRSFDPSGDTGAHIDLALRVTGMSRRGVVDARITRGPPDGPGGRDLLGRAQKEIVIAPTREGFLEIQQLRVPSPGAAPGRSGFIQVSYTGERSATDASCPVFWAGER